MPRWLVRAFYAFRGKRYVRLHCVSPGEKPTDLTIEGFLIGRWDGHYILIRPKVIESEDSTTTLTGTVEIPADRVFFVEVLMRDGRA